MFVRYKISLLLENHAKPSTMHAYETLDSIMDL